MWEIYFWLITGILIILGLFAAYWFFQRHLKRQALTDGDGGSGSEFTLPELREMLKKGLINPEEFAKLKDKIISEVNPDYFKNKSAKE